MSRLIESVLIGFPLPAFYFDIADDNKWKIVDGLQRLSSIYKFVLETEKPLFVDAPRPGLKLTKLEFLQDLNDKIYDELDRKYIRRIGDYQITCFLIKKGTPRDVKYSVFHRINTGGLTLNKQEIRNALATEKERSFLKGLAKNSIMKGLMGNLSRMRDEELILRFWAFYNDDYFAKDNIKQLAYFLDKAMEVLKNSNDAYKDEFKKVFEISMNRCSELLGPDAFKKVPDKHRKNASLFETWTVALAKLSESDYQHIYSQKKIFLEKKNALLEDTEFLKSITSSTSTERHARLRRDKVKGLLDEVLK